MTTTAKPAQPQHRLWAIVMLLPVLLACLSSCHSITVEGKKTFAADSVHKTIKSSQHSGGGGGGVAIMWGPNGGGLYGAGAALGIDYEKTRVIAHEKTINKESGGRDAITSVNSNNARINAWKKDVQQNDAVANAQQGTLGGQSGFFAGDDGFRIKNSGTATLEGATFVSTAKAEAEGKNHFSTDRLIRKDLENHSEYKGKSVALGLSAVFNGDKNNGTSQQIQWLGENFSPINVGESGLSSRFGYDRTSKNDRGTTYASINTANITINDAAGQQALTGESVADTIRNANRGMTLATAKEQSGAADAHFDAAKVENSVRTNAQVMKTFTGTVQEVKGDLRKWAEENRRESIYQRDPEKRAAQLQRAEQQEQLAVAVDMLGGALTPANSVAGSIANTLAPAITHKIGQEIKKRGLEGTPEHIALHAVMAGARTALNGGSTGEVLASAAITGTAEYSTPQLAKLLYGKNIDQLTAAEKNALGQTIGALTTGAGAMTGGNSATTYNAGKTAQNAVENNRQMVFHEFAWIDSNAKKFAQQEGITEDEAKARLIQQAAREIDGMSALMLPDHYDARASGFLHRLGKSEFEEYSVMADVPSPTNKNEKQIRKLSDTTFPRVRLFSITEQQFFTNEGDDYWKPGINAESAYLYNKNNNRFVEKYLTSGITRDYRKSAAIYANNKALEMSDVINDAGMQLLKHPWETSNRVTYWAFNKLTSSDGLKEIWQGTLNTVTGIPDRIENSGTNLYTAYVCTWWPFNTRASETMHELNTLYGRNMTDPMAELGGVQALLSGAEVFPMAKGAAWGYKAAAPAVEKAIKSTAPVVKKSVSNDAAAIASKQSNWKQVEELINSSVGKTSSGAADKSLKAGGQNGTGVTTQKIYTDSNGNPIGELVGNGRRGKTLSDTSKIISLDQDIFSNRTLDAYNEASLVKAIMDKKDSLKNGKVIPRYRDNKNQVITVITHEDGTVSVGISGTKINNM